jgi:hypothetical protein
MANKVTLNIADISDYLDYKINYKLRSHLIYQKFVDIQLVFLVFLNPSRKVGDIQPLSYSSKNSNAARRSNRGDYLASSIALLRQ